MKQNKQPHRFNSYACGHNAPLGDEFANMSVCAACHAERMAKLKEMDNRPADKGSGNAGSSIDRTVKVAYLAPHRIHFERD